MPDKVVKIKSKLNPSTPLPELYVKNLFFTYIDDNFKEVNYCRADLTRHLMLLKAMEYDLGKRLLRFEDLIDAIPQNVCSRSHKVHCINDLCERGIFERRENPNDRRSTIIAPSKRTSDQYLRLWDLYKTTLRVYDFV
jgi:DNA-binding MarR family transcriptional regulator